MTEDYRLGQNRFTEIIPGAITWIILLLPFFCAIFKPIFVVYFMIAFDLYWLIKALVFGVYLISGYSHLMWACRIDWLEKLKEFSRDPSEFLFNLIKEAKRATGFNRKKLSAEVSQIKALLKRDEKIIDWQDLWQVVILTTVNESSELLDASISSYVKSSYNQQKIIMVLATEERAGVEAVSKANFLKEKYQSQFADFLISTHPDGIEGELKSKGANLRFAGKNCLRKYIEEHKLDKEKIIVHAFDSDTRVHRQYFANVAYKYITNPSRLHRSFQPVPLYSNNIWDTPSLMRIVAFGSSFWQMIESTRPHRMINFSSQAMSYYTLEQIDFWDSTIVSEDSRQYYRAFFKFNGDHKAVPIFTPVYMDAVLTENLWGTIKGQYLQKRRWAWGVEHFPYLMHEFKRHPKIDRWEKFVQITRLLDGHINWSTASLLLTFAAWLPFVLNPLFRSTVLALNWPILARDIMTMTWLGLLVSTIVSVRLLPARPQNYGSFKSVIMYIQWALVPITAIFFGSIPAVDAQTRLMFGKYLGFWVTPKASKKVEENNQKIHFENPAT